MSCLQFCAIYPLAKLCTQWRAGNPAQHTALLLSGSYPGHDFSEELIFFVWTLNIHILTSGFHFYNDELCWTDLKLWDISIFLTEKKFFTKSNLACAIELFLGYRVKCCDSLCLCLQYFCGNVVPHPPFDMSLTNSYVYVCKCTLKISWNERLWKNIYFHANGGPHSW